ncbi:MAG: hypothetical protein OXH51_16785 [Gemmatimonadetes bacterium]|nr:hypothetical protein [Gemmatimonadota bacterium]MCY3678630.1 hypothetical protein [Gemmatimonadota bacterium]
MSDDRESRIAELERQLAALRTEREEVQVVKRPLADDDATRIAALERKLEEVAVTRDIDQRPAIQVIQRVEGGGKQKRVLTPAEEKATQVMGWGCAVAMVLWTAWCFSLGAAVLP